MTTGVIPMRELEAEWGGEIRTTIASAITAASQHGEPCCFEFNGVAVVAAADSNPELLYRDWDRGMKGYLGESPAVGPHPTVELSQEELDSDAKIEAENSRRRAEREAEYEKKRAAAKLVMDGALKDAAPIELRSAEAWKRFRGANTDDYGGRVVQYAEDWARLMQTRIANGESLAECAEELSHAADHDGITGFMYGCAVQMLAECWVHGEELRRWHNKETQVGTEGDQANESGGVLNPAMLSIERGLNNLAAGSRD